MKDIDYLKKYLVNSSFEEGIKKLNRRIPVQYIVGNVDFYGNQIKVNPDVLIPRFETEELVEKTIHYIQKAFSFLIDIVDLGTGSGCIAITIKKELNCNMDAVDISLKALEVAKENAKINQVDIQFYHGNMLEPLSKKYDVVISNPPYLSHEEDIMDIVKNNEPSSALYAQEGGLYFYRQILMNVSNYLKSKYIIAFEIGDGQGTKISELANQYLKEIEIKIERDMQGRERFLFIFSKQV